MQQSNVDQQQARSSQYNDQWVGNYQSRWDWAPPFPGQGFQYQYSDPLRSNWGSWMPNPYQWIQQGPVNPPQGLVNQWPPPPPGPPMYNQPVQSTDRSRSNIQPHEGGNSSELPNRDEQCPSET